VLIVGSAGRGVSQPGARRGVIRSGAPGGESAMWGRSSVRARRCFRRPETSVAAGALADPPISNEPAIRHPSRRTRVKESPSSRVPWNAPEIDSLLTNIAIRRGSDARRGALLADVGCCQLQIRAACRRARRLVETLSGLRITAKVVDCRGPATVVSAAANDAHAHKTSAHIAAQGPS
jgi:hypothetical protein